MLKKIMGKLNDVIKYAEEQSQKLAEEHVEIYFNPTSTENEVLKAKAVILRSSSIFNLYNINYIGGHYESPNGRENVKVIMLPHGIVSDITNDKGFIPYSEIKTVELQTQEQIESRVTLTRAIAFGWYALALQKKNKVVKQYLIINCEKNGMKYSMAFAGDGVSTLYTDLFKKRWLINPSCFLCPIEKYFLKLNITVEIIGKVIIEKVWLLV